MPYDVTNCCYGTCRKSASECYCYLLLQVTMCIVVGVNCSADEHRTLSLRLHPPLIKLQKALRFPKYQDHRSVPNPSTVVPKVLIDNFVLYTDMSGLTDQAYPLNSICVGYESGRTRNERRFWRVSFAAIAAVQISVPFFWDRNLRQWGNGYRPLEVRSCRHHEWSIGFSKCDLQTLYGGYSQRFELCFLCTALGNIKHYCVQAKSLLEE